MTLTEEIISFLKGNGISCRQAELAGTDVISVTCRDSEKIILPIEINARTAGEAEEQRKTLSGLLPWNTENACGTIIVTEDRWRRQPEMMRCRLLAHLEIFHSIYARNCEIRRIEKPEAAAFLKANHSYGDASCRYRYGMFLKRYTGHTLSLSTEIMETDTAGSAIGCGLIAPGTLVAVAEFSNARKWLKGDKEIRSYEWTRYASLSGVRICGGMGRMLKHFISQVLPDDIMSYADLEWSDGSAYRQLGFIPESMKSPVTFRIDPLSWERIPVSSPIKSPSSDNAEGAPAEGNFLYFQNPGSLKYRLKLTEW